MIFVDVIQVINQPNQQTTLNANGYDYTSGSILDFPWICFYSVWDWLHTWLVMKSSKLLRVSLRLGSLNRNWNRFGLFVDSIFKLEYIEVTVNIWVAYLHFITGYTISFHSFVLLFFNNAVVLKLLNRSTTRKDSRLSALKRVLYNKAGTYFPWKQLQKIMAK